MKILVTGIAGFIGFHTAKKLAEDGHAVFGIDNINDYYDTQLKYDRLNELGFHQKDASTELRDCTSFKYSNIRFKKVDLVNNGEIQKIFKIEKFDKVCHLAAQAGVRYSINNPRVYIDSNVVGFLNILEGCRNYNVKHLIYASSSSVYGNNKKVPFETTDNVDCPISLYAATKKSNELMAYSYGHLYGFKTTGLRFFTVYGPWGRPDMAYYLFAEAISNDKPIKVFNNGEMERDFTYIDDIINGVTKIIEKNIDSREHYKIYNIGNNKTESLQDFIASIEIAMEKKAIKEMHPMQQGDVPKTWADISELEKLGYKSSTKINEGVELFVKWFKNYSSKK